MSDEQLKLMTRDQVLAVLAPNEKLTHVDVTLGKDKDIFFKTADQDGAPVVTLPDGEHPMTSGGLYEAARSVGIPETYSRKCPFDLLYQNLDHWYRGGNATGKLRFLLHEGTVVGVNPNHPQYYNTSELLGAAEEVIGAEHILGYHQVSSNLEFARVCVVTDHVFEAVSGDALHGGLDIQNSIIGQYKIEITPYIFRQWCSNGAITSENISQWSHRNDGDTPIGPWVRNATSSAFSGLNAEFQRIHHLTEVGVEGHVPDTLASIFRRFNIPVRIQKEIVGEAAAQNNGAGPQTMYDLWNCLTRVGTYSSKLSRAGSRALQFVAGDVTKETSLCPSCHQLMHYKNA